MTGFLLRLRRIFFTGLLVLVPLGLTVYFLSLLSDWADELLTLIPPPFHLQSYLPFHLPGLGAILVVLFVFATGFLANNLIGRQLVRLWEQLLGKIPMVRGVYSATRKMLEAMISDSGRQFERVGLVQFPRPGTYALGFVTGSGWREAEEKIGQPLLHVFVPTTPNVTTGFFLALPEEAFIALPITVKEGMQLLISAGILIPKGSAPAAEPARLPGISANPDPPA